jgi:hypothetical protein
MPAHFDFEALAAEEAGEAQGGLARHFIMIITLGRLARILFLCPVTPNAASGPETA